MSAILHNIVKCEYLVDKEENHDARRQARVYLNALVSLIIGVYATYLSYSINSGVATPLRIIYAVFAGMFGIFYLMYYFFIVYLSKVFVKKY